MRRETIVAIALLLAACGGDSGPDQAPALNGAVSGTGTAAGEESIPDTQIGLSKTSVFEAAAPVSWTENESMPGDQEVRARAYVGTPPAISHGIADFLPITLDDNNCLLCHLSPDQADEDDFNPPLPASHMVDLRHAPDETRDEVAGARYLCTSCHVVQNDAPPLVANRFGAAAD